METLEKDVKYVQSHINDIDIDIVPSHIIDIVHRSYFTPFLVFLLLTLNI